MVIGVGEERPEQVKYKALGHMIVSIAKARGETFFIIEFSPAAYARAPAPYIWNSLRCSACIVKGQALHRRLFHIYGAGALAYGTAFGAVRVL